MSKAKSPATLDALRTISDPRVTTRNKIHAQFARLKKAGAQFQSEKQFIAEAVISARHLPLVKQEFAKHFTDIREVGKEGRVTVMWFPNPADAATIRKEQAAIRKAMETGQSPGV